MNGGEIKSRDILLKVINEVRRTKSTVRFVTNGRDILFEEKSATRNERNAPDSKKLGPRASKSLSDSNRNSDASFSQSRVVYGFSPETRES